jgi:hypothetical protein
MAESILTPYDPYKTGSSLSYPVIIGSPYTDWRSLLVRVKVKTATELFLGAVCELADTGTAKIVEKTADKSLICFGIIPDTIENRNQLQIDNSGAAITKALFFAANSYIYVLPLIPGFIISCRLRASVAVTEVGNYLCATSTGDFRTLAAIATDVDQQAKIARVIGGDNTNGTGVQYVAAVIV